MRIAEAVEACMSSCTLPGRPHRLNWQLSGAVRTCATKNEAQSQTKYPALPSELTSGTNGVGQHWCGTCLGYMPQWLGETCCERGRPREHEQPLPHCKRKKKKKSSKNTPELYRNLSIDWVAYYCKRSFLKFKDVSMFHKLSLRIFYV